MTYTKDQLDPFHKYMAVQLFNETWDLIDKQDRSTDDTLMMIHKAHSSLYHWSQIGTPLQIARGEWQVSHVYSLLAMGESALLHANHSLTLCLDNQIGDFDLAFGYSSVAHAYKIIGNEKSFQTYYTKALEASESIVKKEDKDYFISELNKITG